MNIYVKYLVFLLEAIILGAVFWYKGPNTIFAAFLFPVVYFVIGLIHGQLIEDRVWSCVSVFGVGILAGIIITLAGYHISSSGVQVIGKEWFITALLGNVLAYSVNVLGLLEALVGVFVSHKVLGALLPNAGQPKMWT